MALATKKHQKKKEISYAKLKGLRAQTGTSMAEMARILGISEGSYLARENGRIEFKISEAKIICDHFNVMPSEIFF